MNPDEVKWTPEPDTDEERMESETAMVNGIQIHTWRHCDGTGFGWLAGSNMVVKDWAGEKLPQGTKNTRKEARDAAITAAREWEHDDD